jgi:hypothetical protein
MYPVNDALLDGLPKRPPVPVRIAFREIEPLLAAGRHSAEMLPGSPGGPRRWLVLDGRRPMIVRPGSRESERTGPRLALLGDRLHEIYGGLLPIVVELEPRTDGSARPWAVVDILRLRGEAASEMSWAERRLMREEFGESLPGEMREDFIIPAELEPDLVVAMIANRSNLLTSISLRALGPRYGERRFGPPELRPSLIAELNHPGP